MSLIANLDIARQWAIQQGKQVIANGAPNWLAGPEARAAGNNIMGTARAAFHAGKEYFADGRAVKETVANLKKSVSGDQLFDDSIYEQASQAFSRAKTMQMASAGRFTDALVTAGQTATAGAYKAGKEFFLPQLTGEGNNRDWGSYGKRMGTYFGAAVAGRALTGGGINPIKRKGKRDIVGVPFV